MNKGLSAGQMNFLLVLLTILFLLIGVGVYWINTVAGWGLALGMGLCVFLVITLLAQQFITGSFMAAVQQNLVNYEAGQAQVEGQRARVELERVKVLRENNRVQLRVDEQQYKQLMDNAKKIAGLLSDAEREKLMAQMQGYGISMDSGGQTIDGTFSLDN